MPQIQGTKINEFFDIVRPIIEFKFEIIQSRSNNIFELQTQENIDVLLKVGLNFDFIWYQQENISFKNLILNINATIFTIDLSLGRWWRWWRWRR